MKRIGILLFILLALAATLPLRAADPLRVFLRGGAKTHGPAGNGLHDHERWVTDWKGLLAARGARVDGGLEFPTEAQLANTDVLVMFAANAGNISPAQRATLDTFLKRGGGVVCFHDAVCGDDAPWFKTIIGGAWEHGHSKWFENEISFYYVNHDHPITAGASNFDIDDEIYWDLHLMPEANVLAGSWEPDRRNTRNGRPFPHIYSVIPQMWSYEKDNYRAFVSLLGHKYGTFQKPHVQAVLLRGIAWAGKRDVDALCTKEELATLRYPEGGPVAPDKAAARLDLHPEFNIRLVASEPLVNKAMNIDWDPAGRMWVAETPEYPNGRRGLRPDMTGEEWKDHGGLLARAGQQDVRARDRISILSDRDGDGLMDTKSVFFEGLELVTSFVLHKDGVIASAAPDIFWLRDQDGDGKAETVEKLYTGLGINDTHAVINNLRWGFDGWIYATHGYSAGDVTSPDGSKKFGRIGSGVVRFKPDGSAFEQYSSKGGNTWGLDIAWDNEVFYTQPTSGDLLNHVVMSEATLARGKVGNTASFKPLIQRRKSFPVLKSENLAYVQIDLVGSFTAAAGCAIYDGGTWPEAWNYNYFTTEPTINLVHHEVVTVAGTSYDAHKTREPEFIGGHDLWFRPIETRIGPDGALYIIDFYNQAVIHNDTRGPRHNRVNAAVRPDRDHYFARIWKVDHKMARGSEIPDLSKANVAARVKALGHANRHVRMNAFRLLTEAGGREAVAGLAQEARSAQAPYTRVAALWALQLLGATEPELLQASMSSPDAAVRKNALRIAQNARPALPEPRLKSAVLNALNDSDARVRLEAIQALGAAGVGEAEAAALVAVYPSLQDRWLESAVVGLMAQAPLEFLKAALSSSNAASLGEMVGQLSSQIAAKQDPALAGRLVTTLAGKPAAVDSLKRVALEALGKGLKPEVAPPWSGEVQSAFQTLLRSANPDVPAAALPLIGRWDKGSTLSADVKRLVETLLARLNAPGQSVDQRVSLGTSLLGVRQMDPAIPGAVAGLLMTDQPAGLKRRVIEALGATGDPAAGRELARAYPQLNNQEQEEALAQILKRADWSRSFLDAVKNGAVKDATLRPSAVHSLRNHSDASVASAANRLFDELRGPALQEKNAMLAKLTPAVTSGGDAAKGKELFVANCATCHRYGDLGRDVGPNLTGMGAHGAAELLVHILDPNRALEDNYLATSIETKNDEVIDGVVVRENQQNVVLRNAGGEMEIAKNDILTRRTTAKSLMPEGFEALGDVGLRDLLTFMTAAESKYRFVDLSRAFTADTRKGLYIAQDNTSDTLKFAKFGPVSVEGVPFNIVDPARATGGRNVVVLKGGSGRGAFSRTLAQKVEVEAGYAASALHFLGGVAGWGYPWGGDGAKGKPVMKVTVRFAGGTAEEIVLKNGEEFADYIGPNDVPASKRTSGVVTANQLRYFSKPLSSRAKIESITLESFNNDVAPTTVAITAELAEAGGPPVKAASTSAAAIATTATATPAPAATPRSTTGIKVLITGGGSSHDYEKWFNQADTVLLERGGLAQVVYSDKPAEFAGLLAGKDVLCQTANQALPDPATRRAIADHVAAGKGLVIVHAGLWYNWNDWPEYNRDIAGGGSKGHDRLGPYQVDVTAGSHPLMAGVPATFEIVDELYYFEPDAKGPPIEVLATAHSKSKNKTYPMVFVVKHPKARVVAITLGHDGRAHDHPAYQALLRNAIQWAAGK